MNNELNLPNNSYPLAALVALSELQDEVVKAQAAAAAKEAELAELREQTAELFAERLRAEGADDEAVAAAKAMWAENPSLAAQAALGADIIEAANPYGCNQYGEGWKQPHNGKQSWRPGNPANKKDEEEAMKLVQQALRKAAEEDEGDKTSAPAPQKRKKSSPNDVTRIVQQALRKAAEEDEGDAHEMTLSEMLDDEDNKRH